MDRIREDPTYCPPHGLVILDFDSVILFKCELYSHERFLIYVEAPDPLPIVFAQIIRQV